MKYSWKIYEKHDETQKIASGALERMFAHLQSVSAFSEKVQVKFFIYIFSGLKWKVSRDFCEVVIHFCMTSKELEFVAERI